MGDDDNDDDDPFSAAVRRLDVKILVYFVEYVPLLLKSTPRNMYMVPTTLYRKVHFKI